MFKDTVQRVVELMKATFGDTFAEYYDGDPDQIPEFNLPALVVTMVSEETTPAAFGQDDVEERIVIKVILNKADDWAADIDPLNLTERKIRDIISARDATTREYLPNTVKGALRRHLTEGVTAVGNPVSVEYGILPRSNGIVTSEGQVTVNFKYPVDVIEEI